MGNRLFQHVRPAPVVLPPEVEPRRPPPLLRPARLPLRPAQGDEAALRRAGVLPAEALLHTVQVGLVVRVVMGRSRARARLFQSPTLLGGKRENVGKRAADGDVPTNLKILPDE